MQNVRQDLKELVPYYTKISFLLSLIGVLISCIVIPTTEPKPYTRKAVEAVRAIELPSQLNQLEEPPPPPKPEMPIAAESDEEVEMSTIDPTAGVDFKKAPPIPEAAPEVYEPDAVDEKPQLLQKYCVKPEYPSATRRAEIEGQVVLELVVDTTGFVIDIKVLKSLHELLDAAAVKAVSKWRFKPAKQRDRSVRCRVWQPVTFNLEE